MEGYNDRFMSFFKFFLLIVVVFIVWGRISDDMARRGVFGKEEQQKALRATQNVYANQNWGNNNTASVYYAN